MNHSLRRSAAIVASFIVLAGFTVGCGSSGQKIASDTTTSATAATALTVHIKNYAYDPKDLSIKAGDKVTFVNDDAVEHTATAADKSFDTGLIKPGASKTITVKAGVTGPVAYICSIHQYMKGTLTVSAK